MPFYCTYPNTGATIRGILKQFSHLLEIPGIEANGPDVFAELYSAQFDIADFASIICAAAKRITGVKTISFFVNDAKGCPFLFAEKVESSITHAKLCHGMTKVEIAAKLAELTECETHSFTLFYGGKEFGEVFYQGREIRLSKNQEKFFADLPGAILHFMASEKDRKVAADARFAPMIQKAVSLVEGAKRINRDQAYRAIAKCGEEERIGMPQAAAVVILINSKI
jgi:hypothetical protein